MKKTELDRRSRMFCKSYWVAAAAMAAFAACGYGCKIEVGEAEGEILAGFNWSWAIVDADNAEKKCEEIGAEFARIEVKDSKGVLREWSWACGKNYGETELREIATGAASVTATLLTADMTPVNGVQPVPFSFTFKSGTLVNDLGEIKFSATKLEDPRKGADASLTWKWGMAAQSDADTDTDTDSDTDTDADTDTDDDVEYLPFDSKTCSDLKIDYVNLWVWNSDYEKWWTDAAMSRFRCDAYDHPEDDEIWGSEIYSGAYVNDLLPAGQYGFYLGFYSEAEPGEASDVLLYWDEAGPDKDIDGVLAADEETDYGTNYWMTLFDPEEKQSEFGVLKVKLIWNKSDGTPYASCVESDVSTIGFLLRSDGWVASETSLDQGVECLDWLKFTDVPVLDTSYDLLVSGVSEDGEFLWHNLCAGLEPELNVSMEEAEGYVCEVANLLQPSKK